jgi:uncharacterized membrane protein YgdD (TMEM256/DUF423 family)
MARLWIGLGSLNGLIAVGMAALAAHQVPSIGPDRLQMLRNAVQMQGWHALALVGCGLWALRSDGLLTHLAGSAFLAGTILFCGAVYALSLAQAPVGFLAPLGGSLLMLGWLLLALSAVLAR